MVGGHPVSIAANSATGDNPPTENREAEKTAGTAAAEKWEGSGVFLLIAVKSAKCLIPWRLWRLESVDRCPGTRTSIATGSET